MQDAQNFIQVILPLKLEWEPFYKVPDGAVVEVGDRVWLSFARRPYLAVVSKVNVPLDENVNPSSVKEYHYKDDNVPSIGPGEIALWRAVATYYMCTVGEVYKVAYPPLRSDSAATRLKETEFTPMGEAPRLNDAQRRLLEDVLSHITGKNSVETTPLPKPILMNCPDASAVLEHLARQCGGSVLWLVPELSFSKALEKRLRSSLGSRLIMWTSTLTPARKRAAIKAVRSGGNYVVVGTRSAVFLPHGNLSLIMVQDEHDASYKQGSPSPRYNGRDTAVMLSGIHRCPIVLSSATPSLESIYNIKSGRYAAAAGAEGASCTFDIVDTRDEYRKHGMTGDIPLRLVYHCRDNACKPAFYKPRRAMFPKIEELLPQLKAQFGEEVFISEDLVEQPLPQDCSCLAIYGVDSLLGRNDFRADEKALQVIAGAAGSMKYNGNRMVFVVTRESDHSVFQSLKTGISALLEERQAFGFPPYGRIVDLKISDSFPDRAERMKRDLSASIAALGLCKVMSAADGLRLIFAKDRMLLVRKEQLRSLVADFEKSRKYVSHISFDVDPL